MAQKIDFNERGLTTLELNTNINNIKSLKFARIENYPNIYKGVYEGGFLGFFTYYYLISDSMYIEEGGIVKDVFFACDMQGNIRGIFLAIENIDDKIKLSITNAFGPVRLTSASGIGLNNTTSVKSYWNNNNVSVFLTQKLGSNFTELSLVNTNYDEKSPKINLNVLYR